MTTLKGLILKESDRGESSKSICVLTAEKGVIYIYVRGGRKSTKNAASTQAFSYSTLCFDVFPVVDTFVARSGEKAAELPLLVFFYYVINYHHCEL